jgi:hypothetical protein
MDIKYQEEPDTCWPPVSNTDIAIRHFQESLTSGKHWYISLLEAIRLWTDDAEIIDGQNYQYLIAGEAFDWLLLAERLCQTVDGKVPEDEKYALLFKGQTPLELTSDEFKNLIGTGKYHQFLNYFYGVTVEESLLQAVREEVRKERRANGLAYRRQEEDDIFFRIYGEAESSLLKKFRKEKHIHPHANSNITQMKEFTYWRFKFRVRQCEKARVASDTQKGLDWLKKNSTDFRYC